MKSTTFDILVVEKEEGYGLKFKLTPPKMGDVPYYTIHIRDVKGKTLGMIGSRDLFVNDNETKVIVPIPNLNDIVNKRLNITLISHQKQPRYKNFMYDENDAQFIQIKFWCYTLEDYLAHQVKLQASYIQSSSYIPPYMSLSYYTPQYPPQYQTQYPPQYQTQYPPQYQTQYRPPFTATLSKSQP